MMKFPTEWKNNPNVPNHQPVIVYKNIVIFCRRLLSAWFSLAAQVEERMVAANVVVPLCQALQLGDLALLKLM